MSEREAANISSKTGCRACIEVYMAYIVGAEFCHNQLLPLSAAYLVEMDLYYRINVYTYIEIKVRSAFRH